MNEEATTKGRNEVSVGKRSLRVVGDKGKRRRVAAVRMVGVPPPARSPVPGFWFVLVDSFGSTLLALHVGLLAPQLFWRSLAFKAVQAETGSAMLLKTHNEHAP